MRILRHKITIQQPMPATDEYGDELPSNWTALVTRRAEILPITGKENFGVAQEKTALTHHIRLRADSETLQITAAMRVAYGSRIFQIVAPPINEHERGRWLRLVCEEKSTDIDNGD